jgi:hypothetical protein
MKKFLIIVLLLVPITMTQGCSYIRGGIAKTGQWDIKNAEASRQLAKDFLSTWSLNSGFIRASLGENIGKLPFQAVKAMDELDILATKTQWTDFELGASLGLRVRMLGSLVVTTLQQYFPNVLKDIPSLIGLLL